MLALLIHVAWALGAALLYPVVGGRRLAVLVSALLAGMWVVVSTEALSLGHAFSFGPLVTWWVVTIVGLVGVGVWRGVPRGPWWPAAWRRPGVVDGALAGVVGALAVGMMLSAALSPPNNSDSQTYHLPRQVKWVQHKSVEHYASPGSFELMMPPFAEYVGAQWMILSRGDWWANLVQFQAAVLTMVAVSLAVKMAGGGARAQWVAALLTAANPTFYLMASTPKNDIVVALWICVLVVLAMRIWERRRVGWFDAVCVGGAMGLMALTKGTGPVIGFPVAVVAAAVGLRVGRWAAVPRMVAAAGIALALNAPHFARNQMTFGSPTGVPADVAMHNNADRSPAAICSVLVRNVAAHLALPNEWWNGWVYGWAERVHRALGRDVSDPATTFQGIPFAVRFRPANEDSANATALCVLAIALPLWAVAVRRSLAGGWWFWVLLGLPYAGFAALTVMFRWQEWGMRLEVPIFCLLAVPMALVLTAGPAARVLCVPAVAVVLVNLVPSILDNPRPLFGPLSVFREDPRTLLDGFNAAETQGLIGTVRALQVNQVRTIGLAYNGFQYRLEREALRTLRRPRFTVFAPRFRPERWTMDGVAEVVIGWDSTVATLVDPLSGAAYELAAQHPPYSIYVRDDLFGKFRAGKTLVFAGWDGIEGAGPMEGPYPQWDLPVIRWGFGPETRVKFTSPAGGPMVLRVKIGRPDGAPWRVTGSVNGVKVFEHEAATTAAAAMDGRFTQLTYRFEARPGRNEITFAYDRWDTTDPAWPRAVLFEELAILADPAARSRQPRRAP